MEQTNLLNYTIKNNVGNALLLLSFSSEREKAFKFMLQQCDEILVAVQNPTRLEQHCLWIFYFLILYIIIFFMLLFHNSLCCMFICILHNKINLKFPCFVIYFAKKRFSSWLALFSLKWRFIYRSIWEVYVLNIKCLTCIMLYDMTHCCLLSHQRAHHATHVSQSGGAHVVSGSKTWSK